MEVALQPLPLLLAGLDHPRARAPQLLEVRLLLGLQAAVLERDPGGRTHRSEQLGLILQRRVVQQRSHVRAVAVDQRRRPPARRSGSSTAPAIEIRPALELGQPVRERQRRIAKGARERIAQIGRRRVGAQLDERVARPPSVQDARAAGRPGRRPAQVRASRKVAHRISVTLGRPTTHARRRAGEHHQAQRERVDQQTVSERRSGGPRGAAERRGSRRRSREQALSARS